MSMVENASESVALETSAPHGRIGEGPAVGRAVGRERRVRRSRIPGCPV